MVKHTVVKDETDAEKKKKRPWRNKVRKLAKKKAAQIERETTATSTPINKKKQKKKKLKEDILPDVEDNSHMEEKIKTEEKLNKVEEFKEKLESGRFRFLNEQLYTTTGAEAFEFFKENPDAFMAYHKGFAKQVEKWPNHPLSAICNWLKKQDSSKVVYDLGCGEAKIAEVVGKQHKVESFDLYATNDRVTVADMAHLPVEESSADVVIFCLSLMGTNLLDFIKEARRVLKTGGILKIAEVSSRFQNLNRFCEAICQLGFDQKEKKNLTDYFVMLQFVKIPKVQNKRPLGLKLKPCLYKKR